MRKELHSKKWTKDLNRYFPKEDVQRAHTVMKKCSTSLIIIEKQIKITKGCHLTPVRIAAMNKSTKN